VYQEVFVKQPRVTPSEIAHTLQFAHHLNAKTSLASRIPPDSHNASTPPNLVPQPQFAKSHNLALKTHNPTSVSSQLTAMLPPTLATKSTATLPAPLRVVSTSPSRTATTQIHVHWTRAQTARAHTKLAQPLIFASLKLVSLDKDVLLMTLTAMTSTLAP